MADMLGNGIGQFPLEQWFYEMPVCTRLWMLATVATSVLVQCKIVTPFNLFYSLRAVFVKNQYWRLATTFFYFGPLSLDLLLHVYFLQRYSRLLEETSGGSPAHYSWLLAYAAVVLLCLSPVFSIPFLGQALSSTLVYIWSRRNPDVRLSILGLVVFRAPFLPWVLILFSFIMHGHVPKDEICGLAVGHDIFPPMYSGYRPMDPPAWWTRLFDGSPHDEHDNNDEDAGATHEEIQFNRHDLAPPPDSALSLQTATA